jgi:YcfA-like protein.
MNVAELKKLLKAHGCKFENHRAGSGHQIVRRGDRKTTIPSTAAARNSARVW